MNPSRTEVSPDYAGLAPAIERLEDLAAGMDVVYDKRNRVGTVTIGGTKIYVKCFRHLRPLQRIIYTWFRPSKPRRAYLYSRRLSALGFPTATAVGYAEYSSGPLLRTGYYASLPAPGVQLKEMVLRADPQAPDALRGYGRYLRRMHDAGVAHGDPNISNVYFLAPGSYTFIDTNRARFRTRPLSRRRRLADLWRLTDSPDALRLIAEGYDPERADRLTSALLRIIARKERNRRLRRAIVSCHHRRASQCPR